MWEELLETAARYQILLVYFCVILPVTLTLAPDQRGSEPAIVQEFRAYRLQQFDLQGNHKGSRAWRLSYEAAALGSRNLLRKCVVVWWRDLLGKDFQEVFQQTLGGVLIVLPAKLDSLSPEDAEAFQEMEVQLLEASFNIPIFFALSTTQTYSMLQSLEGTQKSQEDSAFSALVNAVTANAYQLVTTIQSTSVKVEQPIFNIVGKLSAFERGSDIPTVAVVAYYDSFGGAPGLSFGADSNGSGVSVLLEIARLLHRYYQSAKTRAKYNIVFVLTTGGQLNYQGSRHWIEEQLEQSDGVAQSLEFVVCLDSLGMGKDLRMHVSKLPKEGSVIGRFLEHLKKATESRFGSNRSVELVQKKINLADEFLAWEHERYSIRRLPAFTLSHYSKKHHASRSILDKRKKIKVDSLKANAEVITEALFRYLYGVTENMNNHESSEYVQGGVSGELLESWVDALGGGSRAAQTMALKGANHRVVADLFNALESHTHDAALNPVVPDKKDPEFVLYGATEDTISAYRVKPAVFDLILAAGIAAYLGLFYLLVLFFSGHSSLSPPLRAVGGTEMTEGSSSYSPSSDLFKQARKRLLIDQRNIERHPERTFCASPVRDDLFSWEALIIGQTDSPFEYGTFRLSLQFSHRYPYEPPKVKFLTPMFHPNIYTDGSICLDMLGKKWSPTYDILSIVTSVQSLLTDPNPNSPANNVAATLYRENRKEYNRKVKQSVEKTWSL